MYKNISERGRRAGGLGRQAPDRARWDPERIQGLRARVFPPPLGRPELPRSLVALQRLTPPKLSVSADTV